MRGVRITWLGLALLALGATGAASPEVKLGELGLDSALELAETELKPNGPEVEAWISRLGRAEVISVARLHPGFQLSRLGRPAVPVLLAALKHEDAAVRLQAVSALGRIGPRARAPLPALADAARNDRSGLVRVRAAVALARLDGTREPAVAALVAALRDQDPGTRAQAAQALGWVEAREAVPALAAALKDTDPAGRGEAAAALGQLGAVDPASAG